MYEEGRKAVLKQQEMVQAGTTSGRIMQQKRDDWIGVSTSDRGARIKFPGDQGDEHRGGNPHELMMTAAGISQHFFFDKLFELGELDMELGFLSRFGGSHREHNLAKR